MRIEHAAIWCADLETLRRFYEAQFGAISGPRYDNPTKQFSSYFLRFTSGARLELMQRGDVTRRAEATVQGPAHLAFAVGAEDEVRATIERLRQAGVPVVGEPRRTGDGYFEAVVTDPEGNLIEIVAA
ncbi:VOC family protein [Opitutus sp. ER46]|uniref:VOC family protein n=1 Tax=Opitutus sp. ER46 TaxID=2161864 RepID=UPI000D320A20|nr:VOC family protein [Opitutus sp. ER46]PTX99068.1 hypothetical protein DB354_03375 [Opitutus sp. ER46]